MFTFLENVPVDLEAINVVSVLIRLLIAAFIGGSIGLEREKRNRPAGFRTHILVCVGAAIAMMTNQYIFETYGGDPARLGAQVISGIGFLGAGTILVTKQFRVRGLTTAAGLWASACLGLAIGIGFYSGAIIGGIFVFLVITILQRFDYNSIEKVNHLTIVLEIENISALKSVVAFLGENDISIRDIKAEQCTENTQTDLFIVSIAVVTSKKLIPEEIIVPLRIIEGVRSAQRV